MTTVDLIGYLGSGLLLLSMMMKNIRTLRWVNILGCSVFIIYAILLNAIPILITNAAILIVNVYYLFFKKVDS